MSLMLEAVDEKMTHDFYSERYTSLIGIEVRTVQRGYGRLFRVFDAEEKVKTRNFLREIGKILGNHLRFDVMNIPFA